MSLLKYFLHNLDLKLELITHLNFTSTKSFPIVKELPQFYQDILISFGTVKSTINGKTTDSKFLENIIWGNKIIQQHGKCLFIRNWIRSGFIFVKDLFDKNGNFLTEETICNRLETTRNWMAEYILVKRCILIQAKHYNCNSSFYINTSKLYNNYYLHYRNKQHNIKDLTSKFYYKILAEKKSEHAYTEKCWQKSFNIEILTSEWKTIYNNKVWKFPIKKISEFNYKLIHKTDLWQV